MRGGYKGALAIAIAIRLRQHKHEEFRNRMDRNSRRTKSTGENLVESTRKQKQVFFNTSNTKEIEQTK